MVPVAGKSCGLGRVEVSDDVKIPFATITELCGTETHYQQVTIGTLPDEVLLEMFGFYMDQAQDVDEWHRLVHVCRQWRYIVLASPRRLKLRLLCTDRRPVREMLSIWPALPIVICGSYDPISLVHGAGNIIAALEHHDRVCHIDLQYLPSSLLERFAAAMQKPFPALEYLELRSRDEAAPDLPDSFLGEPASHLRSLVLKGIAFPALQSLLLSAHHLVWINLWNIPDYTHTSPEAIVTCLSVLTRLETLRLGFRSPRPRPDQTNRRQPPQTRTDLPSLTWLRFQGDSEYLEDLVAQINAPLLDIIEIMFFDQPIFDISYLPLFISGAEKLSVLNQADIILDSRSVVVKLSSQRGEVNRPRLTLGISSIESDWQLSSLVQVCGLSLPPLSTLEQLDILEGRYLRPRWQDDNTEITHWQALLHLFTAVKKLFLSEKLALHVAFALQELTEEGVTEVLPALQNVFLEGLQPSGALQEAIGQFVAARQFPDCPLTVNRWERGQ